MPKRVRIPRKLEKLILLKNKHACCICRYQDPIIHHIDGDPSNNNENNLAVLCPNHASMADAGLKKGKLGAGNKLTSDEVISFKQIWEKKTETEIKINRQLTENLSRNGSFELAILDNNIRYWTRNGSVIATSQNGSPDNFGSKCARIIVPIALTDYYSQVYTNLKPNTSYCVSVYVLAQIDNSHNAKIWTTGANNNMSEITNSKTYVKLSDYFTTDSIGSDVTIKIGADGDGVTADFDRLVVTEESSL